MTDTASGELIANAVVERHAALMRLYVEGVAGMCVALWSIREEKTYVAQGFKSYGEFLERQGINANNGRLWANSGPVLRLLRDSGEASLILHVDMLRPIARMLNPAKQTPEVQQRVLERQLSIVRTAGALAHRRLVPLTTEIIEEVAEKNFGWLTDAKRKKSRQAEKRAQTEPLRFEHPTRTNARRGLKIALLHLDNATTAVQYGYVHRLEEFKQMQAWIREAEEAAARFDHNTGDLVEVLEPQQQGGSR